MASTESVRITISGDEGTEVASRNLENLDFESQRLLIVDLVTSITENVKERDKMKRDKSVHPLAHIKLSTKLESEIIIAYNHLDTLKAIYSRLCNSKKKKKYTDNELAAFEDTINNFDENLQNLENTIRYRASNITRHKAELDLNSVSFDEKSLSKKEQNYVAESIRRWNERDQDFDVQLQEIGEAVDRIGEVAVKIGTRAQDQAKLAIETVSQFENTTKGISDVTLRIKKVLKRQRFVECYFRFLLIVAVLILSGALIYLIIRRLKK